MLGLGQKARAAARVLAFASTEAKNRALLAAAEAHRGAPGRYPRRQPARHGGRAGQRADARLSRPARTRRQAPGRHGHRPQGNRRLSRPGRRRHGRMGPPERPQDRPRPHPARGHRRHLREPPQRHRRRRRPLPQGRQRRRSCAAAPTAFTRRAPSMPASSTASPPPACPKRRSRSCRRPTAPPSARCSPGLAATLDVIVPRGGKSLVARVQAEARVPVFAHLEGIVHVYVAQRAPTSTSPQR